MARKMKPAARLAMIVVLGVVVFGGLIVMKKTGIVDKIAPQGNQAGYGEIPKGTFSGKAKKGDDVIDIAVVPWGGYAGGQYPNKSFEPNTSSEYYEKHGIKVKFWNMPETDASLAAWKSRQVDLHWYTIDAMPVVASGLIQAGFEPKFFFQADWSRGGDAIVAVSGINSTNDLYGKKIAVAFGTPSHTFLIYALDAGGLNYSDVDIVTVKDAIDAAAAFKAGKVDAAVVWSPDDDDCVQNVAGSKVLMSTRTAKYIIADGFFAHADYISANRDKLAKFLEIWFTGAATVNGSDQAKREAARILSAGFGSDFNEEFCYNAINNVRLCTYGDNEEFFELKPSDKMSGRRLYEKMGKIYKMINLVSGALPAWDDIIDISVLQSLSHMSSMSGQMAEGKTEYKKISVAQSKQKKALATKEISITFPTGSYQLSQNAKTIIDFKFVDIALMSSNRIRIEGNTDNTGSRAANMSLSQKRAQACADYLIKEKGINPNRVIVIGNGPDKPVADNSTAQGREKNRRTDFILLEE